MPVSFRCGCGQQLEVDVEHAGQRVECPTCQQVVTAPAAGPTLAKPAARPKEAGGDYEVIDGPAPAADRKRWADADRPRRERAEEPPKAKGGFFGTESWILRGGVLGGLAAMAVAVVWFVLGLMADRIFFYPPILFLVGLFGVGKGIVNGGGEGD